MISERERRRRARAKAQTKIDAQIHEAHAYSFEVGKREGKREAEKQAKEDLRVQERKASIELAKSLSLMVESCARAVVTFIGEGGLRP